MMEAKQPSSILERIQDVYYEYPAPFWVLITGTFIDRLGTNLIMPFLDLRGSALRCTDHTGGLYPHAQERLGEKQKVDAVQLA